MSRLTNPMMDRRSALRGTALFAGTLVALPAMGTLGGCSAPVPADISARMPLVSAMVDRIIPATDTPGALAAGVPDYVARVAQEFLTSEQRGELLDGLAAIATLANNTGLSSFESASEPEQDRVLTALIERPETDPAHRAWRQVRDLTVFGFYTSEAATQELAYEELPGRYEACLPLDDVGKAWLDRGGNWQQDWDA